MRLASLSDEALEELYAPPPGRHVRAGFVASIDGAIEFGGRSGGLNSADDHRVFVALRAVCDVILVGSGTLRAENYGPATLSAERRARRVARGQAPLPTIAVANASASLAPDSRLFVGDPGRPPSGPRPVVLCSAQAEAQRRQALAEVAEVIECGEQSVEPDRALAALADRGLTSVLCEGGPTLSTALLRAGLLDELCLSQALVLAGPGRAGLSAGEPFAEPVRLRLGHLLEGDDILAGRWEIVR